MSEQLPPELLHRCQAIAGAENQGEPLNKMDYIWFALVTVVVPALVIFLGVAL